MIDFQNKKIMIIVAHPDDELLGLGGTMHKLISEKNSLSHVLILGEGITSRSNNHDVEKWKKELDIHAYNIKQAQEVIGYHSISTFSLPDNRFDSIPLLDLIKIIEEEINKFLPDIIFTHHGGDLNIDHQRTFEATMTACRPMENESINTIITFETPSGTEWQASSDPRKFNPNFFVEISKKDIEKKCKAMEYYEFEKRSFPHPRSSKALMLRAQMWGISNAVGYAEAFQIIRLIYKK